VNQPENEVLLDVSELEPCEPMELSLQAAGELAPGCYLRILHRREPHPLFPLLERLGCQWRSVPGSITEIEVFVWREGDDIAQAGVDGQLAGC